MKSVHSHILVVFSLLLLAGCEREELGVESEQIGTTFTVTTSGGTVVKAAATQNRLDTKGADNLFILEDHELETKATIYAEGALDTSVPIGLLAYKYSSANALPAQWTLHSSPAVIKAVYDGSRSGDSSGKWAPVASERLIWPGEGYVRYFAYAPYGTSGVTVNAASGAAPTISYTVPATSEQVDLLVSNAASTKQYEGKPALRHIDVPMTMAHALTAVRFRIVEGMTITSVSISGVYDSGVLDLSEPTAWSGHAGSSTYELTGLSLGNGLHADSENPGYNIVDNDKILLLLPQSLPPEAKVKAVVTDGVNTNVIEASLIARRWDSGQMITYTITSNPDLWEYTLTLPKPELIVKRGAFEGSGVSSLTSYRGRGGVREAVSVTMEYSLADADGNNLEAWTATRPAGLTGVSVAGGQNKYVSVSLAANTNPVPDGIIPELVYRAEHMKSMPQASSLDLSLYDFGPLSSPRASGKPVTANCYVLDRPGTFRFPLVYGNAIDYSREGVLLWDHGINYLSYLIGDDTEPTGGKWVHFQRFDGKPITSPYILDDLGLTSSEVEAVVVWEETEGPEYAIFGDLSVQDFSSSGVFYDPELSAYKTSVPYLCFSIPLGTIDPNEQLMPTRRITGCRPGNALVALRLKTAKEVDGVEFAAGTILWSWHIWLTDGFDTDNDYVGDSFEPVTAVMRSTKIGPTADIMPMNLGWIDKAQVSLFKDRVFYIRFTQVKGDAEPVVLKVIQQMDPLGMGGSSVEYQWGRKDPLIPSINSRNISGNWTSRNQNVWSPAGYTVVSGSNGLAGNGTPSSDISSSVQNPHVFFWNANEELSGRRDFNFMCAYPYNLWNMRFWDYGKYVYKTVYDPCPPGYSVPHEHAFSFLSNNLLSASNTDIFFSSTNAYNRINMVDLNEDGSYSAADVEHGAWFYVDDTKTTTIFLPVCGVRYYTSGQTNYPSYGHVWTAGAGGINNHVYGSYSGFSPDRIGMDRHSPRSYGNGIRPVKEFQP